MAALNQLANFFYQNTVPILMVVLGLGFVIFIHELGHFLLAKWNGVKVEKFAIGFDFFNLRLYQKQIGETTYVLGALPLGGYVKMLGEDAGEAGSEEAKSDPRAYHNKPVGARMAIISAGVIMNVLFGLACFAYVYMRGKPELAPVIGTVMPGMPAYNAGLRTGDRVVSVDGKPVASFDKLRQAAIFSGPGQVLKLEVKRPGETEPRVIEISPRLKDKAMAPTLGVRPPYDLELPKDRGSPFLASAGFEGNAAEVTKALKGGGIVEAVRVVGGEAQPVESLAELDRFFSDHAAETLEIGVRPGSFEGKGSQTERNAPATWVSLAPARFVDFGFRMTAGPVAGLRQGGIAESAGIEAGDRVVAVDGDPNFDPMRLPTLALEKARQGGELLLEVERGGSTAERHSIRLKPDASIPWPYEPLSDSPLDIPGLGMALSVEPVIAAVAPGSAAEAAGFREGQVIQALVLTDPGDSEAAAGSDAAKPQELRFVIGKEKPGSREIPTTWAGALQMVQQFPRYEVAFEVKGLDKPLRLKPTAVDGWYYPWRGLRFLVMVRTMPPQSLVSALGMAWGETVENISFVYYLIRGLIQRRMSPGAVGGPIPIAQMAYSSAKEGFDAFLPFLGMLSINLAVVNFFPIPPLDGGQLLFLICEKVRGRPVPEKYATPVMLAGVVLILMLFLLVNIKDVMGLFS